MSKYDNTVHTYFLKGGAGTNEKSGQGIMIEEHIISVGYWLYDKEPHNDRDNFDLVHNFKEYKEYYETIVYPTIVDNEPERKTKPIWKKSTQHQLYDNVKKGDLVWTRVSNSKYPTTKDGYYVTRLQENPIDLFYCANGKEENLEKLKETDCLVGLKDIIWYGPFSEDEIPGSISRYIMGKTIVKVDSGEEKVPTMDKDGNKWTYTSAVSQLLLASKSDNKVKPVEVVQRDANNEDEKLELFKLVGWRGLEDLVAMWLQKEKGYCVQPSTCKMGTVAYEYVLINPNKTKENGNKIFVQTKNSDKIKLDSEKYRKHLSGQDDVFYLITLNTNEIKIIHKDPEKDESIPLNDLVEFVFNKENDCIIPSHIIMCRNYLFDYS